MMVLQNFELSAPTTSYANAGGTGNRTASISVAVGGTFPSNGGVAGTPNNTVDGAFGNNDTDGYSMGGAAGTIADGDYWEWTFGSDKYVDEIKLYSGASGFGSLGNWKWQYWDGASFIDLNTFTWTTASSATQTVPVTSMPVGGTTKIRMTKSGGGNGINTYFTEIEFKIAAGAT